MFIPYFAYGSNMPFECLQKRVPSARVLGTATLGGYALRFNKLSKDGSGKATIVPSPDPEAVIHGVLSQFDEDERPRLDKAEGLGNGYQIRHLRVRRDGAEAEEEAFTSQATRCGDRRGACRPIPVDWHRLRLGRSSTFPYPAISSTTRP